MYAVNGTIQTSDRREKRNVQQLQYGLDEVMALRAVSFDWITGEQDDRHLGLIAQEVERIVPEVVVAPEGETGHYGLRYSELIAVLIKAVQEQQELIATQSKLISSQGNRIAAMEAHLGRALGSN